MTAALRRIDPDPGQGSGLDRREPSPAVRRRPSLTLVSSNTHRLTTATYAGQGCPNAAGGRYWHPCLARHLCIHTRHRCAGAADTIHNIVKKTQAHALVQPSGVSIPQHKTSYDWSYIYNPSGPSSVRPHAPVKITGRTYTHDLNGNQTGWTHDTNGTNRTLAWDEENRIQ